MSAGRTARERARTELTTEIKDEARRQLATEGAHSLSLRAVARSLGMVSSAIYRYFPSRDHLLTALIIDAYDAMGDAAEKADPGGVPTERWHSVCVAIRRWALEHRHEYALIYGSPVPGHQTPRDTATPAARVPTLLIDIARDARPPEDDLVPVLAEQAREVLTSISSSVPEYVLTRVMVAWTQLFGMVGFELSGQFIGGADPADPFFDYAVQHMTRFVGLRG
ncbi:MAG: TetR/AcrR family transcriptional regulator [Actinomycetota bacterium]|nr:TetR/AcrR family transcriptional regulator [Actinomycetota bacterium]